MAQPAPAGRAPAPLPGLQERRDALERRHAPWTPRTLAGALDAVAAEHPDRPFVLTDDRAWSYAELADWSRRLARGLVARGVPPGRHVALLVPNRPELVALLFAVARAGAVAVPVNVLLRTRELEFVLRQSGSVALVAAEQVRTIDHAAALDAIAPGWETVAGGTALPELRLVATAGASDRAAPTLAGLELDPDPQLDAELRTRAAAATPSDRATTFYTSGTTGEPKGVALEHDMLLRSAYGSALTRGFEDARRILFALPLQHVFAYVEGLLAGLFAGGAIVLQETFDPEATLRAIARHAATEALFVPTMSLAVVETAAATTHDLSSLHSVMSAAAPAPARLWNQLEERLGLDQVVTGYGMTETSAATTFTFPGDPVDRLVDTVGRPKLGGIAGELAVYRTIDPTTGAVLPAGGEGELVVRGPIVTHGYHDAPQETTAVLDEDGWLRSGDLGRVREDGYLVLTGRSKDLYKCGAELVMPVEVETRLTERDDVAQAHVVPIPDERMGEVGCAFVVPAAGATPDPDELIAHCRATLARFKVPSHVLLIEAAELPLTASGKVRKFLLAERARRELLG